MAPDSVADTAIHFELDSDELLTVSAALKILEGTDELPNLPGYRVTAKMKGVARQIMEAIYPVLDELEKRGAFSDELDADAPVELA